MTDQTPSTEGQEPSAASTAPPSSIANPDWPEIDDSARVQIEPPPTQIDVPDLGNSEDDVVQAPETPAPISRVCATVTIERDVRGKKDVNSEFYRPISVLRVSVDELNKYAAEYPKINVEKDRDAQRWLRSLQEAQADALIGGALLEAVNRVDSEWAQGITHEGNRLAPGKPLIGNTGGKLVGQAGILKMQNAMGIGSSIQIPLWHSGIWVNMNAPSDIELLNMERRIADEKITLGRMTNGLIYSHSSVYIINHLMTLILDSIHDVNIKDYTPDNILDLIKAPDLMLLAWGLACTIYPNGYDFKQPCVKAPDKCKHVSEERINIGRLFFFDQKGATVDQRRHMANRGKKYTVEEIQNYQTLGKGGDNRTVQISDQLSITLKVPSVNDYIKSGFRWIESIEKMVGQVLTGRPTDQEKNDFVNQHSIVTIFRQYAHWVKTITFRDNDIIEDQETLEEALSMLSSDQKLYDKFFNEIKKFIDDSTIALIATPNYDCPVCGTPLSQEETKHPHLVPLDVVSVFFTLVHRRLDRTRQQ